jgi:exocyst complex protein 7
LRNKAENYEDPYLKCIFLLNNAYKISKLFVAGAGADSASSPMMRSRITTNSAAIAKKCKNLNELYALAGKHDMRDFYDKEILTHKREYSKCWTKLLLFIKDLNEANPFNEIKLRDRDRQLLKDRFSGFNKEFEEIYDTQKRYYIPVEQADLAKMLREDNIVYIIGQYKRFYDAYSRLNFATNRDKYIKYAPEVLAARLREFFTAY